MRELSAALLGRADRLGIELPGLALLSIDALVVLALAATVTRWLAVARSGAPRALLAAGLVALAAVVGPATALGAVGALSNRGLVASHVVLLALAVVYDRRREGAGALRRALAAGPALLGALARIPGRLLRRAAWRRERRCASALLAGILLVLAFDALLAVGTVAISYDSHTYRLSRIALWLQSGSLAHFPADDARMSYVGQNADLVMLWLLSFFPAEYPLVQLVQFLGGCLASGATYELAALLGWRRRARLAAVAVLLGIPSVGIQFFTSQTDLFAAGTLAAGVVFALVAARRRRSGEWLLAGVGVGLGLGTKGTALYFAPGLFVLFAAWLVLARCPWRQATRGVALAAAPLLLLSGFNFWQNVRSFGNPFAPRHEIEGVHGRDDREASMTLRNLALVGWQLAEPGSNPMVPERLRKPLYDRATDALRRGPRGERWWRHTEPWMDGKLDEDHSSFGLWVAAVFVAGGVLSIARAVRSRRRRPAAEAAIFVAALGFVVFFCWRSTMNAHQFRYFALIAPFTAIAAAALFVASRRRLAGWGLGLFAALQLATAILVGVRSEYHGWRALVDPETTPHYPIWRDRRALLDTLPEAAREVKVLMPANIWIAPYLRGREPRRITMLPRLGLEGVGALGDLFAAREPQALIADPRLLLDYRLDDVRLLPAPWIVRSPQLAVLPLAPGQTPRPAVFFVEGVHALGWSEPLARFELAAWSAPSFELAMLNASPLRRQVELRSRQAVRRFEVEPQAPVRLAIPVLARDTVTMQVSPPFVPATDAPPSTDERRLGLYLEPSRIAAVAGVFGDGWTAPRATLRLENWLSGGLELSLANPTPMARSVRVEGRHGAARLELRPGGRGRISLPVLPIDLVELVVEPPFVPAATGGGATDARELGVLLDPELLEAPATGRYR